MISVEGHKWRYLIRRFLQQRRIWSGEAPSKNVFLLKRDLMAAEVELRREDDEAAAALADWSERVKHMHRRLATPTPVLHNDSSCYGSATLQQDNGKMVVVAEYRLPEVRAGMAMYFDFPRQVTNCRVSFRLLGDVASFVDDPKNKDDSSDFQGPLAAGLSLSSRIKLYYYANPYELGKWASLSAV